MRDERVCWAVLIALLAALILLLAMFAARGQAEAPVARSSDNYGWLRVEQVALSGTGTDGAVSASGSTAAIRGHVYALHLDFASGVTTTTDVTVSQASPALTVLALTDYYTDTWFYPSAQRTGPDGSTVASYDRLLGSAAWTVAAGQMISSSVIMMTATVYWGE